MKSLKVLIQADDINTLKLPNDSSLLFWQSLEKMGHQIYHTMPINVYAENGIVYGECCAYDISNREDIKLIKKETLELQSFDLILVRQNPPFDLKYAANIQMLHSITDRVQILNSPQGLLSFGEKSIPFLFPQYMPKTISTSCKETAIRFLNGFDKCVMKPIFYAGGDGVGIVSKNDSALIEKYIENYDFVILQEFIPEVYKGDIRVFMFEDEIISSIRRIPKEGDFRANTVLGAGVEKINLTEKQILVCKAVGKVLKDNKLPIIGLDLIEDKLIEVNITSPTGLAYINELYNMNAAEIIMQKLIKKFL